MGILDDLKMGFGLKARTEDYDARTARTLRDVQGNAAAADQYLSSRGYDAGYTPQVAQDNRPFFQRLFTSPEGQQSPTPYALGPVAMDKPLSFGGLAGFSPLGMLFNALSGNRAQPQAQQDPRVASAIADLRNPANWTANQGGGLLPKPTSEPDVVEDNSLLPKKTKAILALLHPKDYYGTYTDIDYPMFFPKRTPDPDAPATGPERSGKYPQSLYDMSFDDIFLDSLKVKDPAKFNELMRIHGVEGY